jgi:hypothetical protein
MGNNTRNNNTNKKVLNNLAPEVDERQVRGGGPLEVRVLHQALPEHMFLSVAT